MILDGHIHIWEGCQDREGFWTRLKDYGIDGGSVISVPPASFSFFHSTSTWQQRLENLFYWVEFHPTLYPFYWIDPLEEDALAQVDAAIQAGVKGFKVICNHFFPGDDRAIEVFTHIAHSRKPILFHSGILFDYEVSSIFNRPVAFEPLLRIPGIRFCLAHISWPWCDELIALYAKFHSMRQQKPDKDYPEMFVDITPGTPECYRRDALTKLLTLGMEKYIIFGTDSHTNTYDGAAIQQGPISYDNKIYEDLGIGKQSVEDIYSCNLMRFVGDS